VRDGRFRTRRLEAGSLGADDETIRVRALSPAESLAVRARAIVDGVRPAAALPLLKEAVGLDPAETAALEALGSHCFQENQPDEAAEWLDRAIETGSASHLAYFYRAIVTRPTPGGEDLLRRAIELNPAFAPAYARLADLYARDEGRASEAVPLARRAAELEPDNPGYWLDLGKLLLRLDRPREAREAGERGLAAARSASVRRAVEAFLREARELGGALPEAGRQAQDVVVLRPRHTGELRAFGVLSGLTRVGPCGKLMDATVARYQNR
ncbi:MAG: tetratricopeptide repeat protein, partial [Planctomycetota bacterium]